MPLAFSFIHPILSNIHTLNMLMAFKSAEFNPVKQFNLKEGTSIKD